VLDRGSEGGRVALGVVDLFALDTAFQAAVREQLADAGLGDLALFLLATGSARCPAVTADAEYTQSVARQTATAVVLASRTMRPAQLWVGRAPWSGWLKAREGEDLSKYEHVIVWRLEEESRRPLAAVVNAAAPPGVQLALGPNDLSRDLPGQVADLLERELPGVTALVLPTGQPELAFRPECYQADRCHTPGVALAQAGLQAWRKAQPAPAVGIEASPAALRLGPTGLLTVPRAEQYCEAEAFRQHSALAWMLASAPGEPAEWLSVLTELQRLEEL
jgi:hypothetical protein